VKQFIILYRALSPDGVQSCYLLLPQAIIVCGFENWSVAMREQNRENMWEKGLMFGLMKKEWKGGW